MIGFFTTLETESKAKVYSIHYKIDQLTPEQLENAILVESKLEPELQPRKIPVLYINPQTLEQWYEYKDRPPTQEELLQDFKIEMEKLHYMAIQQFPIWRPNHDYVLEEVCLHNQKLYEVIQAHTSQVGWEPSQVPALFKLRNPENVVSDWVQPAGAHDAYQLNDKVIHNNNVWISSVSNNVWEPSVYGWEIVW